MSVGGHGPLQSVTADQQSALVALGRALRVRGYEFVTPTPATHERVQARWPTRAADPSRAPAAERSVLRDVFGWTRPFNPSILPSSLLLLCHDAGILETAPNGVDCLSRVRFSTWDGPDGLLIFVHSAFPTNDPNSVFFGPDSYRFAALLARTVEHADTVVDIGCGSGVGGLALARRAKRVILSDINPLALQFAAVNVALAGLDPTEQAVVGAPPSVSLRQSDVLTNIDEDFDVVIANPPYLIGHQEGHGRTYRDGGGVIGTGLSLRIATDALKRLFEQRGGQLVLYTGSPVVDGRHWLRDELEPALRRWAVGWRFEELDPDVFGEELERPGYHNVERVAAVALVVQVHSTRSSRPNHPHDINR